MLPDRPCDARSAGRAIEKLNLYEKSQLRWRRRSENGWVDLQNVVIGIVKLSASC
jgi:hypothetical protein